MRSLLTLAALVLVAVLPAQVEPDTKPQETKQAKPQETRQAKPQETRQAKALAEAKKRLATLAEPKTQSDRDWKKAVTRRVAVLEELDQTKADHKLLPSAEQTKPSKQSATSAMEQERKRTTAKAVKLASPDEAAKYEQRFQSLTTDRDARQQSLEKARQKLDRAQKERQGLGDRETKAKTISELSGTDELTRYQIATSHWDLQAVTVRRAYLTEGLARWPAVIEVLQIERDVAGLKAQHADQLLTVARKEAAVLREAEAVKARKKAAAEASMAKAATDRIEKFRRETLSGIAARRAAVSLTKTEVDTLKAQITDQRGLNVALAKEKDRLDKRLAAYERHADKLLGDTRRRAERLLWRLEEVTLPACNAGARRNQAQLGDVLDKLWNLELPAEENSELQELLQTPAARAEPDRAKAVYREAVDGADGLVASLRAHKRQLQTAEGQYDDLAGLLAKRQEILVEYIDFVRARLFWTRTEDPVALPVLEKAWRELPRTVAPFAEAETWSDAREALGRSPMYGAGLGLIAVLVLVLLLWRFLPTRRRVAAAEESKTEPTTEPTTEPAAEPAAEPTSEPTAEPTPEPTIGARFRALLGAILAAAVVPAMLATAVVLVDRLELVRGLELPLTQALWVVALVVLVRGVANRLLAPGGVAIRLFSATEDVAAQLMRSIRLVTTAAVLLYLPLSILEEAPFKLVSVPRLLETAWFLCASLAMIMVVRFRGPVVQQWTRPDGVARQVWRVIAPLFVACMVLVLVLHVSGYRNGAVHLMGNIAKTFMALFGLAAGFKLFTAAAGRAIDAVAARRAQAEGTVAEELEASIQAAGRLTHAVGILAVVIAAFLLGRFWGFGKPLMGFLQEIQLPDADADGEWLTALEVFQALLWVIGGHFVARNIGRIYDSLATGRAAEAGGRFALITLVRYAVVVVAYTLALVTLGVDFSTLGWMATAASVGLGFGLQEIVANFISGLILLFERPVRVGDIIAVGDTSGIVDRITIRATYVTNWERQTFIVPNKNFITQNVINWTRNDQVMRRVLKVGTAYGSDVDKVTKNLDEVCTQNPRVLHEPPHRIWFKGFGEYRLQFEVWVFTNISFGFATMTALYTEIYKRLQEAGIEIPVPKRDVSVHGEGRFPGEGVPSEGSMPGADAPTLRE